MKIFLQALLIQAKMFLLRINSPQCSSYRPVTGSVSIIALECPDAYDTTNIKMGRRIHKHAYLSLHLQVQKQMDEFFLML